VSVKTIKATPLEELSPGGRVLRSMRLEAGMTIEGLAGPQAALGAVGLERR